MSKYLISALRNSVVICETNKDIYIGNTNIKTFETKQQARQFMKTGKFKHLDSYFPLVWQITELKGEEDKK